MAILKQYLVDKTPISELCNQHSLHTSRGYSRFIVHWEIGDTMQEPEVELIIQRALEKFPGEKPRIISDNGPQFLAKDFKQFIRLAGLTHVRTSPYYPQSNGKLERWHATLKGESFRRAAPETVDEARRVVSNSSNTTTRSCSTAERRRPE